MGPLYVVRHGQSEWNLARLTQGQTDHPRLTPFGREQAAAAGQAIAADLRQRQVRIETVVSSDLVRAVETAGVIAEILGVEVRQDRRLREQSLGVLEGLPYEESWRLADAMDWSDPEQRVEGGESFGDVGTRMASVLGDVGGPTVLVSHGDAIRALLAVHAGVALGEAPWVTIPTGAVARVDTEVTWLVPASAGAAAPGT